MTVRKWQETSRSRGIFKGRMSQILIQEGMDTKLLGHFFNVSVQAVLLFGAETWVLTPRMERALSSFQHRVTRRLTGRHPRRQGVGVGTILLWRRKWLKRDLRRSGPTSRGGRICSRSILRRKLLWTSVSVLIGVQGCGCLGGGWVSTHWTWGGGGGGVREQRRSRT